MTSTKKSMDSLSMFDLNNLYPLQNGNFRWGRVINFCFFQRGVLVERSILTSTTFVAMRCHLCSVCSTACAAIRHLPCVLHCLRGYKTPRLPGVLRRLHGCKTPPLPRVFHRLRGHETAPPRSSGLRRPGPVALRLARRPRLGPNRCDAPLFARLKR